MRILGVSLTLFHTNARLAAVMCSVVPFMALCNRVYGRYLRENAKRVQDSLARANNVAQEVLSCFRTVYSFAAEGYEWQRYRAEVQHNFDLNVWQAVLDGIYYMVVSTFLNNTCVRVLIIGYGSQLVSARATPHFSSSTVRSDHAHTHYLHTLTYTDSLACFLFLILLLLLLQYFRSHMSFEDLTRFIFLQDMLQQWTSMLFDSFSSLVKVRSQTYYMCARRLFMSLHYVF